MENARLGLGQSVRVMLVKDDTPPYPHPMNSPERIFSLLKDEVARWDRERFLTLLLNARLRLLGVEEVTVGTVSESLVHPREIFKAAILANACFVISVHNHPSGDPSPSKQDQEVTRRLQRAGELLGIRLLDHIVIGHGTYYSFARQEKEFCQPSTSYSQT